MAEVTPTVTSIVTPTPVSVTEFNLKVAELIKNSKTEDIVEVLRDESSMMKKSTQNVHINGSASL